jgi:ankyrin repeat protein
MNTPLSSSLIGDFLDAAVRDLDRAARLLSEHPELLNARWIHGETVLHFLAIEGQIEAVAFLAQRGADVRAPNTSGDAPLVEVARLGDAAGAEVLLSFGADPNAVSELYDNPLHCAVRSGNARLVQLLLEAGADAGYVTTLGETIRDALPTRPSRRAQMVALLAQQGIRLDPD